LEKQIVIITFTFIRQAFIYGVGVVIFLLSMGSTNKAMAQTISLDQDFRNDQARRYQLLDAKDSLGKTVVDPALSFMVQPIKMQRGMYPLKYAKSFLGREENAIFKFAVLPVQIQQQYVSSIPYQELDGPILASSGYQVMASAGIFTKLGPLTIQLQPQWVSAQNKDYTNIAGTPSFQKMYWGNSSVRLNFGPASLGVSNENISWGPSVFNPLIMSSHAPGFMHATFNSTRPLKTSIGNFEWQVIAAYLDPMDTRYQNLAEVSTATAPGRRYYNGASIIYSPKWIKGLSIGAVRVVQEPERVLLLNKQYFPLINNVARATDANYDIEQDRDQYGDFFMRYLMQPAHAEFYMEWGRNDAYFNLRDAIQRLDHSRAYTLGFRKLFNISNDQKKYWQFVSEYTRMQQPPSWPLLSAGSWYVHSRAIQGYTNEGQIMGATLGLGGNGQTFRINKIDGLKTFGFQFNRVTHDAVYFESALAYTNPSLTKWVDYGIRFMADMPYKGFIISGTIGMKRSFNYQYTQPINASGLGISNPNDIDSYIFKLGLTF
jgi:hypothetical protein